MYLDCFEFLNTVYPPSRDNLCPKARHSTWKAKSQTAKEDWRCKVCRTKAKMKTFVDAQSPKSLRKNNSDSDLNKSLGLNNSSFNFDVTTTEPLFGDQVKSICSAISTTESNLKLHVTNVQSVTENLIHALCSKIDEVFFTLRQVQSSQDKLRNENVQLKDELKSTKDKLTALEKNLLSGSLGPFSNVPTAAKPDSIFPVPKPNVLVSTTSAGASSMPPQTRAYSEALSAPAAQATVSDPSSLPPPPSCTSTATAPTQSGQRVSTAVVPRQGMNVSNVGPKVSEVREVQCEMHDDAQARSANADPDDWTKVTYKRSNNRDTANGGASNNIKIGTKQSSVSIVKPKTYARTTALFVTRFAPEVTTKDIEHIIQCSVSLSFLKVSKIQTRRQDLYSSFHVQVSESEYGKVDDVNIWPSGCMIKPYRGRLLPDIVVQDVSS
ncbi:hypothetical protein WDU94_009881 [Cyamophila willieti]